MTEHFLASLLGLLSPGTLVMMAAAAGIGLFFGALPGLSATMAVAMFLPLTFAMAPTLGIAVLVAVYIGGISGGLVAATLLRIPGTPSSIATTFDAYPLAQKGEAVKALATGFVASAIGGLFSLGVLVAFAPTLAGFAIRFGAHEYAALTIAALTLVVVLSYADLTKGLLAAVLGLAISTIGFAPIGATQRFSFGQIDLMAGIGIVPFMVGLFAVSQIIRELSAPAVRPRKGIVVRGTGIRLREIRDNGVNLLRSSAIGVGIGVLPGIGGAASNLVAYGAARQASRRPDDFGKGNIEGIYASESANNASIGGALLPLITLGIPGDGVTAILIGGFTIHGLQPGPMLFTNEPRVIATIYAAFFLTIVMLLIIQFGTIRVFPKVLQVPRKYLMPILLMMMVVGTYAADNRVFDVWLMLGFGILGYFLERHGFPLAPMVLGFILGPIFETNLRRALMYSDGNLTDFVARPVSASLLVLALVLLFYGLWSAARQSRGGTRA